MFKDEPRYCRKCGKPIERHTHLKYWINKECDDCKRTNTTRRHYP